MPITYSWKILDVQTQDLPSNNLTDVILRIAWEKRGTDDQGNSFGHLNVTNLKFNTKAFTPFDQLSEEQIWSWIKPNLTYEEAIDQAIQTGLENIRNPIKSKKFSWMESESEKLSENTGMQITPVLDPSKEFIIKTESGELIKLNLPQSLIVNQG